MNNKDTFYILHSEFDDCPEIPESLSKRNVVAKLKNVSQEKQTTISFKKLGTLAAAIILVMVCTIVATTDFREDLPVENLNDDILTTSPLTQPALNNQLPPDGETALLRADSREEIVAMFKKSYEENSNRYYFLYGLGTDMDDLKGAVDVTAVPESSGVVNDSFNETASESTIDHAQTNTQTKGVDEGDIIKTDSRYIYFVGSDGSGNKKLKIIDTRNMTAVYNSYLYDENGDIIWVSDMYLKDNILVAVCAKKADYYRYYGGAMIDAVYPSSANTVIVSYDITNRANPKLIRRETQDGSYRSSRLIGNTLYTVSQYYVKAESKEALENVCIPKVSGAEITCDCIYLPENMGDSYICLTALDITEEDGRIKAVAVLGSTENYYCSQGTFYIAAENYYNSSEYKTKDSNSYTIINSFSLDGLNISYKATGEVKGSTSRSQYNLDEYENVLRIATTYYNYSTQKNESSLYTLDENLDIIGKLEDIANNELIKSVRYMGEKAYIVTFRNTDPLFAIDLSDPKNPTVLGELKLPGYSAYLHPISDNLLLGIGYDGDSNNADFNSVKLSLFDISDPVNLKELDNIVLNDKNVSTPVNNNPKALIYKATEGIIGFPVETYDYNISEQIEYGYYIIKVQNGKLQIMHKLIHENRGFVDIYSFRGTYIGDKFFTVSDYSVKKFDFATGKEIAQWSNSEGVNLVPTTAVAENKDTYDIQPDDDVATTVGTSQGYAVDEPEVTENSASTGQTTPPYNPNNPDEVIEMPTER